MIQEILKNDRLNIVTSDHAKIRAQQRGIPLPVLELVAKFGSKTRVAGNRHQRLFTKASSERAKKAGVAHREFEKALGVPVICDETYLGVRRIVTVLPKNSRRRVQHAS